MSTKLKLPRPQGAPLLLRAFTSADAALVAEAGADPLIPLTAERSSKAPADASTATSAQTPTPSQLVRWLS